MSPVFENVRATATQTMVSKHGEMERADIIKVAVRNLRPELSGNKYLKSGYKH